MTTLTLQDPHNT